MISGCVLFVLVALSLGIPEVLLKSKSSAILVISLLPFALLLLYFYAYDVSYFFFVFSFFLCRCRGHSRRQSDTSAIVEARKRHMLMGNEFLSPGSVDLLVSHKFGLSAKPVDIALKPLAENAANSDFVNGERLKSFDDLDAGESADRSRIAGDAGVGMGKPLLSSCPDTVRLDVLKNQVASGGVLPVGPSPAASGAQSHPSGSQATSSATTVKKPSALFNPFRTRRVTDADANDALTHHLVPGTHVPGLMSKPEGKAEMKADGKVEGSAVAALSKVSVLSEPSLIGLQNPTVATTAHAEDVSNGHGGHKAVSVPVSPMVPVKEKRGGLGVFFRSANPKVVSAPLPLAHEILDHSGTVSHASGSIDMDDHHRAVETDLGSHCLPEASHSELSSSPPFPSPVGVGGTPGKDKEKRASVSLSQPLPGIPAVSVNEKELKKVQLKNKKFQELFGLPATEDVLFVFTASLNKNGLLHTGKL